MANSKAVLTEDNPISLRTAIVVDDGDLVYFTLLPRVWDTLISDACDNLRWDSTWLYRRKRSFLKEMQIGRDLLHIERDIKPIAFKEPPALKIRWAASGNSVALWLNGEPWAFIYEASNHGYSKGILRPTIGNPWDQALFEKLF